MNVGAASISNLLAAGLAVAPSFQKLGSAVLIGNQAAVESLAAELAQTAAGSAAAAAAEIASLAGDTALELGYSVDLAGKDGGGDKAGTSCKVYKISAKVPLGKTLDAALAGQTMEQTVRAMASLVKQMAPLPAGTNAGGVTVDWEAAAQVMVDGTTFTITTSPGVPLVNITAELPARALLEAMQAENQAAGALLRGLVRGVREKSLAALRNSDVASLFAGEGDVPAELRKNSTFGISLGGGASAELALEAGVTLGTGASLYAETNPEMLLLLGGEGFNSPDVEGWATVGLDVVNKLNGEVSLGEGVEVTAGGGVKTGFQVLYLHFAEKDQPPTPDSVTVAGFTVTGFQGTVNADGSFSGSGELQLPAGGSVHAAFSVDAQQHVASGSWNGSFRINNHQFNVVSGSISDAGISWTERVSFGASGTADVNCILAANDNFSASGYINVNVASVQKQFAISLDPGGNFTGTYSGSLTVGGRNISNVNLTLNNSGITGTGNVTILGSSIYFSLAVDSAGWLSGSARNVTLTAGLPGGKSVSIATSGNLTLSSDGKISGSGTVNAGNNIKITGASFTVDSSGSVSGQGSVSIGSGSISCTFSLSTGSFSVSGSAIRSKSITVGVAPLSKTYAFSATVSLGVKNTNEIKATASGKVNGVTVGSASVNLDTGKVTVSAFGLSLTFDLF